METRAITIECVHLGYDALIDIFQYENSSFVLCDVCTGIIVSVIKVSEVVKKVLKKKSISTDHLA